MALIDAAHGRGLMVFLDVVYNHFGPEGNFLADYAPAFFTERHHTPWGAAIDYGVPQVREFSIGNALHWLDRYRFDGLRLDAVHAIVEPGEPHILTELSRRVGDLARETGRLLHLVLENDDNNASTLDPETIVPSGRYRAQWNDDYHHAWHVLLTRESHGYYVDYADAQSHLARTFSGGFAYQGEPSPHRNMVPRGASSAHLPPAAFVTFIQNHDQIGNRAMGDRLTATVPANAQRAALAVTLLAPMPVLMFMGDEWGTQRPFPFFCDFDGKLAKAVREGRKREFAAAYAYLGESVPDPLSHETFSSAKLDWDALLTPQHTVWLEFVRDLLSIRRNERIEEFCHSTARQVDLDGGFISACWTSSNGRKLGLLLTTDALPATPNPLLRPQGRPIWGGRPPELVPGWAVYWSIAED
jgi:malto-oligosyltrehalose trehalohydrolase